MSRLLAEPRRRHLLRPPLDWRLWGGNVRLLDWRPLDATVNPVHDQHQQDEKQVGAGDGRASQPNRQFHSHPCYRALVSSPVNGLALFTSQAESKFATL